MFELSMIQSLGRHYLKSCAKFSSVTQSELHTRQQKNFRSLRQALRNTKVYRDLGLSQTLTYEDFLAQVPVYNYEDYAPYVDKVLAGENNILFQDPIRCIGLSSGTSGKNSKRIPYNESMVRFFLKSQKRIASRLALLEPSLNILGASRLTFGSDPCLYTHNEIQYGYISGILATRMPRSLAKRTFPSKAVLEIPDWDHKIAALIDEALTQDIQIVSGIPTYLINIFEAVLKKTGKQKINEIWPHLKVFIYSATPIKQYQDRIDQLVGHHLNYYGVYASTEGAIGLPYEKFQNGCQRYLLNPDLLYSFTPSEYQGEPTLHLGLHEIEMKTPYYINIGCENGLVHYAMKDLIQFELVGDDLVFEFVGRKNTGMNLAAEKVRDDEIMECFVRLQKEFQVPFRHFFLSPHASEGATSYLWTVFTDENISPQKMATALDISLQELNQDYKDCREVGVLGAPQVRRLPTSALEPYFAANRQRGQFKMKTTFSTSEEYAHFMRTEIENSGVLQ